MLGIARGMFAAKFLVDRSTPTIVVSSLYNTSGGGSRKLTRLSNGWLITALYNSGTNTIYIYKSMDNGGTWSQLCYIVSTSGGGFATSAYGTRVTVVRCGSTTQNATSYTFDATTVSNVDLHGLLNVAIDASQTNHNGITIEGDTSGNLYAAWSSKNATYPNSFNIRFSKSTDGGTTWNSPTQITTLNTTGTDKNNPCIVIRNDNNPSIIYEAPDTVTPNYLIQVSNYSGASWSITNIHNASGNYVQSFPSAVVSSDGNIHVSWDGRDAGNPTYACVFYSKSTDGGVTWSAYSKLVSNSSYDQRYTSITADRQNNIYILFQGFSTSYIQLRKIVYSGGSWGSPIDLTSGTVNTNRFPSTCSNYLDFTDPLCIYQDSQASDVKFRGIFYA